MKKKFGLILVLTVVVGLFLLNYTLGETANSALEGEVAGAVCPPGNVKYALYST